MNKTPTTLIIMDGFGLRQETEGNAIRAAATPRLDQFFREYAHTTLRASGLDVGLPDGQMGNSEVGHTNIGGWCSRTCPGSPRPLPTGALMKIPPTGTPWTPAWRRARPCT